MTIFIFIFFTASFPKGSPTESPKQNKFPWLKSVPLPLTTFSVDELGLHSAAWNRNSTVSVPPNQT